ncbi:DMT family transporter [bacterium]|nr:MAG: DMT family transporter [bacterium]
MSRRGLLLFVAMCVIWGIPYLFIRIAVGGLSPATLVFMRTGLAALVLVPVALSRGDLRAVLAKWRPLLAFAIAEIGVPWFFLASAEQHISSSLAGLLIAAVPLVGTVITFGLGNRDRIGAATVAGLLLGVVGVTAIVGFDLHASSWIALLEVGLVVVGYAAGPAILARHLNGLSSVSVTAFSLAICAIAYAPVAALQWPPSTPHADVIASVVVLALVCTALAFLLFFALIAEIGPVRATVITYINPAVAAALGIAVLGETFTTGMGAGFVLVLLGSALATYRAPAEPARTAAEELVR